MHVYSKKGWTLLVTGVIFVFLTLRLTNLGYDLTNSDAVRWHRRSEKFLSALKQGDFSATYQHYQPGVTIMWINAFVKQVAFSYQLLHTSEPMTLENADWYPIIHGISKGAVIMVLAFLLIFQMYCISKLFSFDTAILYGFLLSVEPYILGIDRWFHLTSLETYFAFAAFLCLLLWLKNNKYKFLVFSAILLCLSLLSKITTLLLLPLFGVIFIEYLFKTKKIKPIVIFGLVLIITFFILFPALWVNPLMVIQKIYLAITSAVGQDVRSLQLEGINPLIYYPLILAFRMSPVTFFLLISTLISFNRLTKLDYAKYIFMYAFVYYAFFTISDKKIDRYVIALIPSLILLISVFLSTLKKQIKAFIILSCVFFSLWLVYRFNPVYSAYYSPILGGTKNALSVGIYENSGEYFAQSAVFLNSLGRDKYTFVPDNVESFSYYYKGTLQRSVDDSTNYVLRSLDIDRLEPTFEQCTNLVKSFGPMDKHVVYVYSCR